MLLGWAHTSPEPLEPEPPHTASPSPCAQSTEGTAARRSASRTVKKSPGATGRHKTAAGAAHHAPPPSAAAAPNAPTSSGSSRSAFNLGGFERSAQPSSSSGAPSFRLQRSPDEIAEATALALSHKESGNISFQAARYMQVSDPNEPVRFEGSIQGITLAPPYTFSSCPSSPCPQAEMSYSHAIMALESINENGIDLAVLHSNRAGARLMIGKPLTALQDARRAVQLDPKFIRAVVRQQGRAMSGGGEEEAGRAGG